MKLSREFYLQPTLDVAQALLGKYLVRMLDGTSLVCRITETEGYIGAIDKACHAYGYRRTKRTEIMFGPGGTAYIYLIYGIYSCLNLVTEAEGKPCAVLLRGGEIRHGGDAAAQNRFQKNLDKLTASQRKNLLNGPGKLCKGFSLTPKQNGLSLLGEELFVIESLTDIALPPCPEDGGPLTIKRSKRIGIDYAQECADFLWRFTL